MSLNHDSKVMLIGAPAQNLPTFQNPFFIPKIVWTCSIYSPDDDPKVSMKKRPLHDLRAS
jgi:hypothetical protein